MAAYVAFQPVGNWLSSCSLANTTSRPRALVPGCLQFRHHFLFRTFRELVLDHLRVTLIDRQGSHDMFPIHSSPLKIMGRSHLLVAPLAGPPMGHVCSQALFKLCQSSSTVWKVLYSGTRCPFRLPENQIVTDISFLVFIYLIKCSFTDTLGCF